MSDLGDFIAGNAERFRERHGYPADRELRLAMRADLLARIADGLESPPWVLGSSVLADLWKHQREMDEDFADALVAFGLALVSDP